MYIYISFSPLPFSLCHSLSPNFTLPASLSLQHTFPFLLQAKKNSTMKMSQWEFPKTVPLLEDLTESKYHFYALLSAFPVCVGLCMCLNWVVLCSCVFCVCSQPLSVRVIYARAVRMIHISLSVQAAWSGNISPIILY